MAPPAAPSGEGSGARPVDPARRPARGTRWIWIACGSAALGLGIVGAFLPMIPTTPLVLVAAWCFSKGSERLHRRLLEHRRFGPLVRDWERHRVVRLRAKILATAMIVPLEAYMLLLSPAPGWTKVVTVLLVAWGQVFIWTKPSEPR